MMKYFEINEPLNPSEIQLVEVTYKKDQKWYEKYKKLNPSLFTWDNSGKRLGDAPPFYSKRNKKFETVDIEGIYGMDKIYKIVGYSEHPPFPAGNYEAIAIMFERLDTFEKIWWHYEKY